MNTIFPTLLGTLFVLVGVFGMLWGAVHVLHAYGRLWSIITLQKAGEITAGAVYLRLMYATLGLGIGLLCFLLGLGMVF